MIVEILLVLTVTLIVMALVIGLTTGDELEFGIELAGFKSISFEIGVTNRQYTWDNGDDQTELRIGLFFITLVFSSFKNSA